MTNGVWGRCLVYIRTRNAKNLELEQALYHYAIQ